MWKKIYINNIETNYSVSDIGQVKNDITNKLLKQSIQQGYCHVGLIINGKIKRCRVHRLVAEAFIDNPYNKPYVNHIDGIRNNNQINNLEWCTPQENTQHAVKNGLMLPTREKPVIQYDLNGNKIKEFISVNEACRQTNSLNSKIIECCQLTRKTHNGFQWRYKNESSETIQRVNKPITNPQRVAQINPETNEIIAIYDSICQAAKAVNGTQSAITHVLKGDKNTYTHKGFKWKLVDEIVH